MSSHVLIETARLPRLLKDHGLDVVVASSFGSECLPMGLHALIGHRPSNEDSADPNRQADECQ